MASADMGPPKRISLGYSLKNIPTPPRNEYMELLIEKTDSFVRRMRWRAFHYLRRGEKNDQDDASDDYFGFNTKVGAPHVEELESFEEGLTRNIESIQFRKTRNTLQDKLHSDIAARVNRSQSVFVQADKTRNLYEVSPEQYTKLLTDNTE